VLGLDALELDGNLLSRDDIGSEVDVTEGATTDLTTDAVFITYAKILERSVYRLHGGKCKVRCGEEDMEVHRHEAVIQLKAGHLAASRSRPTTAPVCGGMTRRCS
jgi:hypothetical protein